MPLIYNITNFIAIKEFFIYNRFQMIINILKYWLKGIILFTIFLLIMPENSNFVDINIYVDIPAPSIIKKNHIYLYNKNEKLLLKEIKNILQTYPHKKISITVPKLEYLIYYIKLKFLDKEGYKYKLYGNSIIYNIKTFIYYYHETLMVIAVGIYDLIEGLFNKNR